MNYFKKIILTFSCFLPLIFVILFFLILYNLLIHYVEENKKDLINFLENDSYIAKIVEIDKEINNNYIDLDLILESSNGERRSIMGIKSDLYNIPKCGEFWEIELKGSKFTLKSKVH